MVKILNRPLNSLVNDQVLQQMIEALAALQYLPSKRQSPAAGKGALLGEETVAGEEWAARKAALVGAADE